MFQKILRREQSCGSRVSEREAGSGEQDEQMLEENSETAGAPAVTRARRRKGRPADKTQNNKYADRGIEQMHLQYLSIFKGESLS